MNLCCCCVLSAAGICRFVIPLLWSAQEQLFRMWMSFPFPCTAAFRFRSGSIQVLVLPGYLGLQRLLCWASNFLMKWKNLPMKEKESWEPPAGSLWRIAFQILSRRSWWQHRTFSVMVFPLLTHVLVGPGACPQWQLQLLMQQINFLLNQITWELLGKILVNQKHQGQSCVGGFLGVHVLTALVVSVIWPSRKFREAENVSRFTFGLRLSKYKNESIIP